MEHFLEQRLFPLFSIIYAALADSGVTFRLGAERERNHGT